MNITRKQFLGSLLGAAAGGLVLAACGGDDGGSDTPDASTANRCEMNGTSVNIASNHGHVLMVSKEDVAAGVDKTYDITGTSDHPHSVTVTAANFGKLAMNQSVQLTSTSGGGHTHGVTIMCA
ncbi:MAG: hypothetical protein HOV81_45540 [Kofleriaceae bacterium]|nr:hypothetical protein [Kofleriaceae bacterium]